MGLCFSSSAATTGGPETGSGVSNQTTKSRGDRRSVYFDANDDQGVFIVEDDLFWDAVDEQDDEEDLYPIITTNCVKPKLNVSMKQPETLLRESQDDVKENTLIAAGPAQLTKAISTAALTATAPIVPPTFSVFRRKSKATMNILNEPRVTVQERGYPGLLTEEELEETLKFTRGLKSRNDDDGDKVCAEIVYSFKDIEEEPYTLCRFMRAEKFSSEKLFERLEAEGKQEFWKEAKEQKFYPNLEEALGVPVSVFLTQYPFVYIQNAKNGCPVSYMKAGKIQPEGFLCLTTTERSASYFWNLFMYQFKALIVSARSKDPNFVRVEAINVIDLSGLSSSQMNSDTMDVLKVLSKVSYYFPETQHCMLLLNAPKWFSLTWKVIKSFLDPRTAKKIAVYSSSSKGQQRLCELVDKKNVPSDFGGNGPSILDETQRQGGLDNSKGRQMVELFHIKKGGKDKYDFELKSNEQASIQVYSRSSTGAEFSLKKGSDEIKNLCVRSSSEPIPKESPLPFRAELESSLEGPGKFLLVVKDLCEARDSEVSAGYFLVAISVGKTKAT